MNVNMWENPAFQKNMQTLIERGVHFVEPGTGELACHWYGKGRLAELEDVMEKAEDLFSPKDLRGERILITAGPTQEPIDPVRFITNLSSGKMGYALAKMARRRGAEVILITGPTSTPLPRKDIEWVPVKTAEEMRQAVLAHLKPCSVVIKAAAVADYRPKEVHSKKIKKKDASLSLDMERTGDILAEIGKQKGKKILVGFAAETDDLIANAKKKLQAKNLDLVIANDVAVGFAGDTNQIKILFRTGEIKDLPLMTKEEVSQVILDELVCLIKKRGPEKRGVL
jgi:phosphopantothenoylcysteine decarboxylase/phosphopantothenate--cysteine ligase